MNLHCIQHVPFEGPGSIAAWAQRNGHRLSKTLLYDGEAFPDIDSLDGLVILGGPMGVSDTVDFPWLIREKALIELALKKGKPIIGICLGAQLVAEVLGAKVYKNHYKEIGWFPVTFDARVLRLPCFDRFPPQQTVFHWHGDTFDIPPASVLLAGSAACRNQGFIFENRVYCFQFHLEITGPGIQALFRHCAHEIEKGPYIQSPDLIHAQKHLVMENNRLMDTLLTRLFRLHTP